MLRDLITRMFNISQLIGLDNVTIGESDLRLADRNKPGSYTPITDSSQAEEYAAVKGEMQHNGHEVDFAVGKYASANDQSFSILFDTGDKLTLEWLPPNRKNSVTWENSDGEVTATISTHVDPYLLIMLDIMNHLELDKPEHMYFPEQLKSVELTGIAAEIGREHLSSNDVGIFKA